MTMTNLHTPGYGAARAKKLNSDIYDVLRDLLKENQALRSISS
jgi:hypothetical protein